MAHTHDGCSAEGGSARRLTAALVLASVYMVAEFLGGLWTGSLALLADAGHMLSDVTALTLALVAIVIARRSRLPHPHGAHRAELVAAALQGLMLIGVGISIVVEAFERFAAPPEVNGAPMFAIALGGLAVNLVGLALLHRGRSGSLNLRGAWLHVASDTLGSVGAIVAGGLVWRLGWLWADPLASVAIALLVVGSALALLRETGRSWLTSQNSGSAIPSEEMLHGVQTRDTPSTARSPLRRRTQSSVNSRSALS